MKNSENRNHPRILRIEAISIQVLLPSFDGSEDSEIVKTTTLDVSASGLRVKTEQNLPVGNIFDICIQLTDYSKTFLLTAEIKWCTASSINNEFLAGLEVQPALGTDYLYWKRFFD
ncbi:MAG: hypothetical protein COW84_06040 [Gammaproteobacteria bacterium CG22_combo_CG10-13_8_21_14_all_40_8]|nr:MAG: hypothetical protein COW84_06040 [Gammaproteobacteria bacterium CG22_combo_CG10-13_8_21_14_all_40_8]